jgi:hypothetical protein
MSNEENFNFDKNIFDYVVQQEKVFGCEKCKVNYRIQILTKRNIASQAFSSDLNS